MHKSKYTPLKILVLEIHLPFFGALVQQDLQKERVSK